MSSRQRSALLKYGVRSGLELAVKRQMRELSIPYLYEQYTLPYTQPESQHRYMPDFVLQNGIVVETKGRWLTADRKKLRLIKEQHPDIDLRLVFSNSRTRISKQSKTTYAKFCETQGFLYADKRIPEEWFEEPVNHASWKALKEAHCQVLSGRRTRKGKRIPTTGRCT